MDYSLYQFLTGLEEPYAYEVKMDNEYGSLDISFEVFQTEEDYEEFDSTIKQFKIDDFSLVTKIMNTITWCIFDYFDKYLDDVNEIKFDASSNEKSRVRLYRRLSQLLADEFNAKVRTVDNPQFKQFIIDLEEPEY
jgi:hypothetical protein